MVSALFITGTDTGVGKSVFTSYLALKYLDKGKKVAISKPIQTGNDKDTDLLKTLTNNKIPVFNTYSFLLPAAPSVAAKAENKTIEIKKIISDIKSFEEKFDCVIVEGIGGIAVPISEVSRSTKLSAPRLKEAGDQPLAERASLAHSVGERSAAEGEPRPWREVRKNSRLSTSSSHLDFYLVADLIKELNYPVIVVARPSLGTINHSVLTIEFARQKQLNTLGFIISGYDEDTNDPVIKTAPDIISSTTKADCLMRIPFFKPLDYNSLNDFVRAH